MNEFHNIFKKFQHTVRVTDEDTRAIAEMFFYAGAATALGDEPKKLCSLVAGEPAVVLFEKTFRGVEAIDKQKSEVFSQSELQYLSHVLRNIIDEMHKNALVCKQNCNVLYDNCNPEDENTERNFEMLNAWRDNLREVKQVTAKLANIQTKVKRKLRKA